MHPSHKGDEVPSLQMSYDEAYVAWRYIQEHPTQYVGKGFYARGIYHLIDGKHYLNVPMLDQYYAVSIEFILPDGWFTLPENIALSLTDGDTILLVGEIATDSQGSVYFKNCDLNVSVQAAEN